MRLSEFPIAGRCQSICLTDQHQFFLLFMLACYFLANFDTYYNNESSFISQKRLFQITFWSSRYPDAVSQYVQPISANSYTLIKCEKDTMNDDLMTPPDESLRHFKFSFWFLLPQNPLLICTLFLKNQFVKKRFDKLDF